MGSDDKFLDALGGIDPRRSNVPVLFQEHWCRAGLTLLSVVRDQRGRLSETQYKALKTSLKHFNDAGYVESLLEKRFDRDSADQDISDQFQHLTQAVLNGVLATHHLQSHPSGKEPLVDEATQALTNCFRHYHEAWNLYTPTITVYPDHAASKLESDQVTRFLHLFSQTIDDPSKTEWWTHSNWLLIRRLLSWLIGLENPPPVGVENQVQMLLVATENDRQDRGCTAPVTTARYAEGFPSAYLDPVSLGITLLDKEMLDSLRIVARIAWPLLNSDITRPLALRISPQSGTAGISLLKGGSAGGLVTLASCATAEGHRLNRDCSASFTVTVENPELLLVATNSLRKDDIRLGSVEPASIEVKLTGEHLGPNKLSTVLLHHSQQSGHPGNLASWENWTPRIERSQQIHLTPVKEGQTLADIIHAMTGDERIEQVLTSYSNQVANRWAKQRADDSDKDGLKHYVPPSFAKKVRDGKVMDESERESLRRQGMEVEQPYKPVSHPTADEETRFRDLFALGPRIVVTEDAGAGKSIFTRRATAWCSESVGQTALFEARAGLACRWERVDADWPVTCDGYRAALEKAVSHWCNGDITPQRVVEYALKNGRVVLFLDALDQQITGSDSTETLEALAQLLANVRTEYPLTRVIVTSRAFAYESQKDSMFPDTEWKLCRLTGFSPIAQVQYLSDLIDDHNLISDKRVEQWKAWRSSGTLPPHAWRRETTLEPDEFADEILSEPKLFGDLYGTISELLQVPAILAHVRTLCRRKNGFPQFNNRADLYFQANEYLMGKNLGKRQDLAKRIWQNRSKLREVLSALAFQMMVNNSQNYVVLGVAEVEILQVQVQRLISTKSILDDWENLWMLVGELAGFTSHLVVEQVDHDYIGWKHRGMMEFFCGLFLAKNSTPDWPSNIQRDSEVIRLADLLADPQWEWAVRFSQEVTQALDPNANSWHKPDILSVTFQALFEPAQYFPRPTDHMFHAWQLMQRDPVRYPGLKEILSSYRQQFLDIIAGTGPVPDRSLLPSKGAGDPLNRARRAAELLTERDVWGYVGAGRDERKWKYSFRQLRPTYVTQLGKILRPEGPERDATDEELAAWFASRDKKFEGRPQDRPAHAAYALCSNATSQFSTSPDDRAKLNFMMGASPEDKSAENDEKYDRSRKGKWWIMQKIDSFQMATCCVTRAQYRLFDPHRKNGGLFYSTERSLDDDSPMYNVNWWDAFCFALWLGDEYRLPSELQWEGAAWGGLDRSSHPECVVSVPPYHSGFTSNEVNHNGNRPIEGQKKSDFAIRTLPVRWDFDRREKGLRQPAPPIPAAYQPNGFGLWHMNGNIREWSQSNWCRKLKDAIKASKADFLESSMDIGTARVVRGGGWLNDAEYTRTSLRSYNLEFYHYDGLGFRLTRTS